MHESADNDDAAKQDGGKVPSERDAAPLPEGVGEENDPHQGEANHGNRGNGFKNWIAHLWNQDPDRQLELILAGAIALFALCQLVATILNNHGTSQQVDKIIGAADSIKDSANQIKSAGWTFSGAAQGINNAGWSAVGRLQGQVDQVKRSAKAAEDGVKTTQTQMRLDERAWVGFGNGSFTWKTKEPFEPFKIQTMVAILGKSPAIDIVSKENIVTKPKDQLFTISDITFVGGVTDLKNGTEFPGMTFPIHMAGEDPVTDAEKDGIEKLSKGDFVLYYFGETNYRDVFNRPHWTHFCYILRQDLTTFGPCGIYNDSDDTRPQKGK